MDYVRSWLYYTPFMDEISETSVAYLVTNLFHLATSFLKGHQHFHYPLHSTVQQLQLMRICWVLMWFQSLFAFFLHSTDDLRRGKAMPTTNACLLVFVISDISTAINCLEKRSGHLQTFLPYQDDDRFLLTSWERLTCTQPPSVNKQPKPGSTDTDSLQQNRAARTLTHLNKTRQHRHWLTLTKPGSTDTDSPQPCLPSTAGSDSAPPSHQCLRSRPRLWHHSFPHFPESKGRKFLWDLLLSSAPCMGYSIWVLEKPTVVLFFFIRVKGCFNKLDHSANLLSITFWWKNMPKNNTA